MAWTARSSRTVTPTSTPIRGRDAGCGSTRKPSSAPSMVIESSDTTAGAASSTGSVRRTGAALDRRHRREGVRMSRTYSPERIEAAATARFGPPLLRFVRHIDSSAGPLACWPWQGALSHGYGTQNRAFAHRTSYELFVGPIPAGFEIDHLCRNRQCVNPAHLEAVTGAENRRRAIAARRCAVHDTPGSCDICIRARRREWMNRPEVRARRRELDSRPDYRERPRARDRARYWAARGQAA